MGTGSAALIGRVNELARLRALLPAPGGAGRFVLLEGEGGSGKTRLVQEFNPAATGAALEYAGAPYAPVRDLLQTLDARFPRVLKAHPDLSLALRPVLDMQPEEGQRPLLDAVVRAISLYAAQQPLVLAFEDIHWIDSASAGVLTHLARFIGTIPVLLLATYRAQEASGSEQARPLIGNLARLAADTLVLRPLSEGEAMLLIAQLHPDPLPLDVRRTICELSGGNPLLLGELVRHVAADPQALRSSLPVSLQALVHDRISQFSATELDVLRVCAAMETFDHTIVAEVAQIEASAVLDVLRKARRAGVVTEDGSRFSFTHALIRRAVTADLLSVEVAELHARVARILEAGPQAADVQARLAYHYWMSGNGQASEIYNTRAAQAAFALGAFDDAALMLERAIAQRPVDVANYELYEQLAEAYERAGRFNMTADLRARLLEWARDELPVQRAVSSAIALSRANFLALNDEGSVSVLRDALRSFGADIDESMQFELRALLAWYLVHLRRTDEAREQLDAAADLESYGGSIALIRYYEARAGYDVHTFGGGDWKASTERALKIASEQEPLVALSRYGNAIALACASQLDDYPYAFELQERMQPLLESVGDQYTAPFLHMRARLFYVSGKFENARAAVRLMLPYLNDGGMYVFRAASVGLPLALRMGDAALMMACARPRLLEEAFGSNDPVVFGPVAFGVAEHMIAQGRTGEAVALVERTLPRIHSAGNNLDLLLIAARIGSRRTVEAAHELISPWIERSRSAAAVQALMRAYGATGKDRANFAHAAAELFAALPWPVYQAQALELAGDLAPAHELYQESGAYAEAQRVAALIKKPPVAASLSPRESEVALLVAEGKSNRSIAESLVLSERTVENHVASIFTKLNVRSRAEIASFIARENARAG